MTDPEDDSHHRPESVLAAAMGLGRELARLLRDEEGLFAHRDRAHVAMLVRAAADRCVTDGNFRSSLDSFIRKLEHMIAVATVETRELNIVGCDDEGDGILDVRVVRSLSAEAQPLLTLRIMSVRLADMLDQVRDLAAAERVFLELMRERGAPR